MPASEKTWYDMKLLHAAFGTAGVLLLVATVWMIAADHTREWKQYQRQMRKEPEEGRAYRNRFGAPGLWRFRFQD